MLSNRRCVFVAVAVLAARGGDAKTPAAELLPPHVHSIVTKYCAGCHHSQDAEADFSVQDHGSFMRGGAGGRVITPGDPNTSRLMQLLRGQEEPTMPPEGEPRPTDEEIEQLAAWIRQGAKPHVNTLSEAEAARQVDSSVPPSAAPKPVTAVEVSSQGTWLAVARFGSVDLMTPRQQLIHRLDGHPGKINALAFSADGTKLFVATGQAGALGEVWLWDTQHGRHLQTFSGHRDLLYSLAVTPDAARMATGGYDREILIWDLERGEIERTLSGHNGPVLDLDFSPDGQVLASASADATVKIWQVSTGLRLDTLSQPLKPQTSVDISPDGKFVIAGGADSRLRLWRLVSYETPQINPLRIARFAHEQSIHRVRYSDDGRFVISLAADQTMKLWSADELRQLEFKTLEARGPQVFAQQTGSSRFLVGAMDGTLEKISLQLNPAVTSDAHTAIRSDLLDPRDEFADVWRRPANDGVPSPSVRVVEHEPNDQAADAQSIAIPTAIRGTISVADDPSAVDTDCFRFQARAGDVWIFETKAAREGSKLDSRIKILDAQGRPVPRVVLRAVRDSYLTFRGKDSTSTGDFRLHNWEEMQLNQLLYVSGEVLRLYHYPRGPDSGFNVYPNFGNRHGFFDTTPTTHALHEPCYIVEAYPPGTMLPPNGLPTFVLNYENDDDGLRRFGTDSLLTFRVPQDGEYLVLVEDSRQLAGKDFTYELIVRRPRPAFSARLIDAEMTVPRGAGKRFGVEIDRDDNFTGEVTFEIEGAPADWSVSQPLVVESGHYQAWGTVFVPSNVAETKAADPAASGEDAGPIEFKVVASAQIGGQTVRQEVGTLGPINVTDEPPVSIQFTPSQVPGREPQAVIEVQAGETVTAEIEIVRHNHEGRVGFGKEEAVVNSPHGVFVDDTGLNGVLINEKETHRRIVIRAEPWLAPTERWVFVQSDVQGQPTSRPILLRVLADQTTSEPLAGPARAPGGQASANQ